MQPAAVLSDGTIRRLVEEGRLRIDPWDPEDGAARECGSEAWHSFLVFHNHRIQTIDLADPPRDLTEMVSVTGDESFVIHPGEFVLGRTEERVELPDDIVARIEGKALALDTEVPTPSGWRTMGELEVGDEVFDPEGYAVPVVAATEPMMGRPCREVRFSDGTRVVADAQHRWEVQNKYDRERGDRFRILTTDEIERPAPRSVEPQGVRLPRSPGGTDPVSAQGLARSIPTCWASGSATARPRSRNHQRRRGDPPRDRRCGLCRSPDVYPCQVPDRRHRPSAKSRARSPQRPILRKRIAPEHAARARRAWRQAHSPAVPGSSGRPAPGPSRGTHGYRRLCRQAGPVRPHDREETSRGGLPGAHRQSGPPTRDR